MTPIIIAAAPPKAPSSNGTDIISGGDGLPIIPMREKEVIHIIRPVMAIFKPNMIYSYEIFVLIG